MEKKAASAFLKFPHSFSRHTAGCCHVSSGSTAAGWCATGSVGASRAAGRGAKTLLE